MTNKKKLLQAMQILKFHCESQNRQECLFCCPIMEECERYFVNTIPEDWDIEDDEMMENNMFGKCEGKNCVQSNCNRLESNGCKGAIYSFEVICGTWNSFEWFEGKDKIKVGLENDNTKPTELDDLDVSNTNCQ